MIKVVCGNRNREERETRGGRRHSRIATAVTAVAALLLIAGPAAAELGDTVTIHGFGGWAYGETDGNEYVVGTKDGNYDNADFSLNIAASPIENLRLVAQVQFEEKDDEPESELEYAFAEWSFSDSVRLRVGRVPHPFGIYTEIFDLGTQRPFFLLPQGIYGPQGFIAEFYNGIGVTGNAFGEGSWGLEYDVYAGQLSGEFRTPSILSADPSDLPRGFIEPGAEVQDVLGAKLTVLTPVDGLQFGFSGYSGDQGVAQVLGLEEPGDYQVVGAFFEYLSDRWSLRSEIAKQDRDKALESDTAYLEAGYLINDHWQIAARYEEWDAELKFPPGAFPSIPPFIGQLQRHEELALGINYWFSSNFVLKLSVHEIDGNRFAFPDSPEAIFRALAFGELDDQTQLIVLGSQFSF